MIPMQEAIQISQNKKIQQQITDDLGRTVRYESPPRRIISLCPSITETLLELGMDGRVVGRTRYCIHPANKRMGVQRIGGTKKLQFDEIDALEPDLIIAEREENNREDIERLEKKYPVYVADVVDFSSALRMLGRLGALCGEPLAAEQLNEKILLKFNDLEKLKGLRRCAYLIWRKPWMAAGQGTYINSILKKCGLDNYFADRPSRYPVLSVQDLQHSEIDLILLSSEPYPFHERHMDEIRVLQPRAEILLVDGEMFSWYGARMLRAADYLNELTESLA